MYKHVLNTIVTSFVAIKMNHEAFILGFLAFKKNCYVDYE